MQPRAYTPKFKLPLKRNFAHCLDRVNFMDICVHVGTAQVERLITQSDRGAPLRRWVPGWWSGGAATETGVRHHPTRAATTVMVTLVVAPGSLSTNSYNVGVVELSPRGRKFCHSSSLEDGRPDYRLHRSYLKSTFQQFPQACCWSGLFVVTLAFGIFGT